MQVNVDYQPLRWATAFHASIATDKLIVGGKGSGKTLAGIMEGIMLSTEFPGNVGLFARETLGELEEVVIDPLLTLLPKELVRHWDKQRRRLELINDSLIYFRALDEHRKMKGLNLGWFDIDEVDSTREADWLELRGQLRRKHVRRVAIGQTNPTTIDHWIYDRFVRQNLPGYQYFVAPTKDNAANLPPGYMDELYATMPDSWVKRYLEGQWGAIVSGERVWPEFSEKLHVYDKIVYNPSIVVVRSWDFGLKSAVVFSQQKDAMTIDFHREILHRRVMTETFAEEVVKFSQENFPGAIFEDHGDIAGLHTESTSGRSPIDVASEVIGHRINYEEIPLRESLDLVRTKLSQNIMGEMAVRFHPSMRLAIEGMNGGYVFKKNRDGTIMRDVPASDETFEHLMDPLRYRIWKAFAYKKAAKRQNSLPTFKPTFEDTSW